MQTPLQYFKMPFNDNMIEHIVHHTDLYSAQELGDPIKINPEQIEDFFPSLEDYRNHESHFNIIADIFPRKRFQLVHWFTHLNGNQQCNESPLCKIQPPIVDAS